MKRSLIVVALLGVTMSASAFPGRPAPFRQPPPRGGPQRGGPTQPGLGPIPVAIQPELLGMSGRGCPANAASATVSPDGASVSVVFDKMSTEIPPGPLKREIVTCGIRLGLRFSGPYRVAVVGSDARGFVSVPAGGRSTITVRHSSPFSNDARLASRMALSQSFQGPRSEEVLIHADFRDMPAWSSCGSQSRGEAMAVVGITLLIDSLNQSPTENLIATLDSLDIGQQAALTYSLAWVNDPRCPN